MLGAVQLVLGGSLNAHAEILTRDDALAARPNEKKSAINDSQLSTPDLDLTERQLDVLALMMQGKSNKAICRVLNLAEPTVKNHRHVGQVLGQRRTGISIPWRALAAVAQLLPGFKIASRGGKEITLGELATQHSGLPRMLRLTASGSLAHTTFVPSRKAESQLPLGGWPIRFFWSGLRV
jgi:DNA-binding CsgD family transcriptional regulator